MARPPLISFDDVQQAVEALGSSGKSITPYQVRQYLGRGSEAKIAYFLKGMELDVDFSDSDPLTRRIHALIRPLVLEINDQVEEQIRHEKAQLQQSLEQQSNTVRVQRDEIEQLQQQLASAEKARQQNAEIIEDQHQQISVLQQQLEAMRHELELGAARATAANATIERQQTEIERISSQHEHHMKRLVQEHQQEQARFSSSFEQLNQLVLTQTSQLEFSRQEQQRLYNELQTLQHAMELDKEKSLQTAESHRKDIQELENKLANCDQALEFQRHGITVRDLRNSQLEDDKCKLQSELEVLLELFKYMSSKSAGIDTESRDANDTDGSNL
jgi:chromosome segregation ATPase